jgi:hypothetical protein
MAGQNLECRKVKIVLIIIQGIHFRSSTNEISTANTVCKCGLNGVDEEYTQKPLPKAPISKNGTPFPYLTHSKGKQNSFMHILSILL